MRGIIDHDLHRDQGFGIPEKQHSDFRIGHAVRQRFQRAPVRQETADVFRSAISAVDVDRGGSGIEIDGSFPPFLPDGIPESGQDFLDQFIAIRLEPCIPESAPAVRTAVGMGAAEDHLRFLRLKDFRAAFPDLLHHGGIHADQIESQQGGLAFAVIHQQRVHHQVVVDLP